MTLPLEVLWKCTYWQNTSNWH